MMGMMKREVDMMKKQLELLQQPQLNHSVTEDLVGWEPKKKLLEVDEVSVVAEDLGDAMTEKVTDLKISNMTRDMIQKALLKNGGNRKATAVELGLSERTLYRKIKEYGL